MNWTEILGFATGAATVWLTVKESHWLWPVGIANNVFFCAFAGTVPLTCCPLLFGTPLGVLSLVAPEKAMVEEDDEVTR